VVYAFDERDFAPIAALESLRQARTGVAGRFRAILDEVHSPELLTLALLLDRRSGGSAPDPHLERLQLAADARDAVLSLLARRDEVAAIAFRRDTSDPAVVGALARLAGSDQLLKMLCLATLAHVEAGRHGRLNAWRRDQLWSLYVNARHRVLLGSAAEPAAADDPARAVALAGCPEDIPREELAGFLDGLPDRYLATFGVASVYTHARLARALAPGGVHIALERQDAVWRLTIVSAGTRHLFATVAGVLSFVGMDIHRAQAMTTPDELVLDVFEFSDAAGVLGRTPGATSDLDRLLHAVAEGTLDADGLSIAAALPQGSLAVRVTHERTARHTVVELTGPAARGLLYLVCRTIADLGFDVDLALVSTEGGRSNDVLHVTKHANRLSERDREKLQERLLAL
jgi:[protein-PII] uridylyltransferase